MQILEFKKIWLFAAVILMTTPGCVKDMEMIGGWEGLAPKDLMGSQKDLDFDVAFYNPNFFPIKLLDVRLDVLVDSVKLGEILLADSLVADLAKKDTTSVSFRFVKEEKAVADMMRRGMRSFLSKEPMIIDVKGSVEGKAFGKRKVVDVMERDTFALELPKPDSNQSNPIRSLWNNRRGD
jgi:hypothetical protein